MSRTYFDVLGAVIITLEKLQARVIDAWYAEGYRLANRGHDMRAVNNGLVMDSIWNHCVPKSWALFPPDFHE